MKKVDVQLPKKDDLTTRRRRCPPGQLFHLRLHLCPHLGGEVCVARLAILYVVWTILTALMNWSAARIERKR